MTDVPLDCLNCDRPFTASRSDLGRDVACPSCGAAVHVDPSALPEPEAVPDAFMDGPVLALEEDAPAPPLPDLEPPPPRTRPTGEPLRVRDAEETDEPVDFLTGILGAFVYPFTGFAPILMLVLFTPAWAFVRTGIVPFGWAAEVLIVGYLSVYMFEILHATAEWRAAGDVIGHGGGEG